MDTCGAIRCIRLIKDKKALFEDKQASNIAFSIERNCRALRMGECPRDRKPKQRSNK